MNFDFNVANLSISTPMIMTHPDTPIMIEMKTNYPDVFADFREDMHEFVEEALFYRGEEYANGTFSREALEADIHDIARMYANRITRELEIEATFRALEAMVEHGELKNSPFASELKQEFALGFDSLLYRFISLQNVPAPRNAAISFLAWRHTKALFDLESEFDVNLEFFREQREPEFFCTSEGNMTLLNFSVL